MGQKDLIVSHLAKKVYKFHTGPERSNSFTMGQNSFTLDQKGKKITLGQKGLIVSHLAKKVYQFHTGPERCNSFTPRPERYNNITLGLKGSIVSQWAIYEDVIHWARKKQ